MLAAELTAEMRQAAANTTTVFADRNLALAWQALCVILFVRFGAMIFWRRVMKSGKGGRARKPRFGKARSA